MHELKNLTGYSEKTTTQVSRIDYEDSYVTAYHQLEFDTRLYLTQMDCAK